MIGRRRLLDGSAWSGVEAIIRESGALNHPIRLNGCARDKLSGVIRQLQSGWKI